MYGEENPKSSIKSVILKIVLIVGLLFILVWLFPTKQYITNFIDKKVNNDVNEKLDPLYTSVFNENMKAMQEASKSYFDASRLPKNIGDTKTLTLKEMLDKKLLIEFTDSKGKECDTKDSYVEVTKEDTEYAMKIKLSCSSKKDYILVYMNGNKTCDTALCETSKEASPSGSCEYAKVTNAKYGSYGAWSNWTTNRIDKTNGNQVETKVSKVYTGTNTVAQKKTEAVAATVNNRTVYVCDSSYSNAGTYNANTKCVKTAPASIEIRNGKTVYVCGSAYDNEGSFAYNTTCKVSSNAKASTKAVYTCGSAYDNEGSFAYPVTCKRTYTVYNKINQYKDVTYYRQRTMKLVSGNKDIKWSSCNDASLTNAGYAKTGNQK